LSDIRHSFNAFAACFSEHGADKNIALTIRQSCHYACLALPFAAKERKMNDENNIAAKGASWWFGVILMGVFFGVMSWLKSGGQF
jgi:hypothetical protein